VKFGLCIYYGSLLHSVDGWLSAAAELLPHPSLPGYEMILHTCFSALIGVSSALDQILKWRLRIDFELLGFHFGRYLLPKQR
jgi:hypothetical protein